MPITSELPQHPLEDQQEWDGQWERRSCKVDARFEGLRLDKALVLLVPEFSRNYLQQLIDAGAVKINSVVASRAAQKLFLGQHLEIDLKPTPMSLAFVPEPMELAVIYEDEHILVVDKAAGMVVHPAAGHWRGTLLNGLLARHECFGQLPRAGIVHRLDKDTSGLMVVARTRDAMQQLVSEIAARQVHREYLAIAHRHWSDPKRRQIDTLMGRDQRHRTRMAVIDPAHAVAAKPASTTIEWIANSPVQDACLVACILGTGRTHQIRVHMAHIGHPLIADELYGGTNLCGMTRQALHARHLKLTHPGSGKSMSFLSRVPADIQGAIQRLEMNFDTQNTI